MNQENGKFSRENRSVEHGDSDDWCEKAAALCKLDRWEEALQAYDNALELDPGDFNAWIGKGNALLNLERYKEALQAAEKALELNPNHSGGLSLILYARR